MQQQYPNYSNYYQQPPYSTAGNPARFSSYPAQPQQVGLKGRQVASFDEVKSIPIDFDGSVAYFPDLANKRIYTKQISMDGTPAYNVYELTDVPPMDSGSVNYVTREEFEATLAQIKGLLGQMQQPQQQQQQQPTNVASQF